MRRLLSLIFAAICIAATATADDSNFTLEENIQHPEVPKKAVNPIKSHMSDIAATLERHHVDVAKERDGLVLMITLPCADLFRPNETELRDGAGRYLMPFASLFKYPGMYKVLIAVHSDDTGEQAYADALTEARAEAIEKYLCDVSGTRGTNIYPYGMGWDDPIYLNDSVEHRAGNRRIEIYIVPGQQMIETARAGQLK